MAAAADIMQERRRDHLQDGSSVMKVSFGTTVPLQANRTQTAVSGNDQRCENLDATVRNTLAAFFLELRLNQEQTVSTATWMT
jgi:hypothetical protein